MKVMSFRMERRREEEVIGSRGRCAPLYFRYFVGASLLLEGVFRLIHVTFYFSFGSR